MEAPEEKERSTAFVVRCAKCGGAITIAPGWPTSKCGYCGFEQNVDPALRQRLLAHLHRIDAELEALDEALKKRAVQGSAGFGASTAAGCGLMVVGVLTFVVSLMLSGIGDGTRFLLGFGPLLLAMVFSVVAGVYRRRAREGVVAPKAPVLRAMCRGCGASIPLTSDTGQASCPSCGQPVVADPNFFAQATAMVEEAEKRAAPPA